MTDYLILFAIVLGVNLMPAFGPPTWTVIVLYGLNSHLPTPLIVVVGALAAASGRFLLALGFRQLGDRLPEKTRRNLKAARAALGRNRRGAILGLGLFALSPVPSAQLFEAAGLTRVPLLPFTAAFFAGRVLSYAIYAYGAHAVRQSNLGDAFRDSFTSPLGIAIQMAMLALLVGLTQVNWGKWLK